MKTFASLLCLSLTTAIFSANAQQPDWYHYFGALDNAGDGWYHHDTFGYVYLFDAPWTYLHSLDDFFAFTGPGADADSYYLYNEQLGWAFTSADAAPWMYFFGKDNIMSTGWYFSYGLMNGGVTPHSFFSHSLRGSTSTRLTIEIVNATVEARSSVNRIPSDQIYLTLYSSKSGNAFAPSSVTEGKSIKLSALSPVAGSANHFQFSTTRFDSGRLFISYNSKDADKHFIPDSGVLPGQESQLDAFSTTQPRNDKIEITYLINGGIPTGSSNLTAVDYFAIPMTLETLDMHGNVLQQFTYYANTETVLKQLQDLGHSVDSVAKIEDATGQFLRFLAPQQWAGSSSSEQNYTGKNPYPSMNPYLQAVAGQSVTIEGAFDGVPGTYPPAFYRYTTTLQAGGNITLSGQTAPVINGQPGGYTNAPDIVIAEADVELGIYTANPPYTVGGAPHTIGDNDVYSAVVRDLLTGFNAGYIGGTYSAEPSNQWWHKPPFQPQNGNNFYNVYARVIQDNSEAYGFAFSDRLREQLASFNTATTTLRITLLADDMLNAPNPELVSVTDDSVTLKWEAVTGADSYTVSYTPPLDGASVSFTTGGKNTITGLDKGTPYQFTVRAKATIDGGTSIESPARTVAATTSGDSPVVTGDGVWQASLNFDPAMVQGGDKLLLNGYEATINPDGTLSFEFGRLQSVTINDGGSDYTSVPSISFSGGGGFGATGHAVVDGLKQVSAIFVDASGYNYSSPPDVVIDGGGGSGATATAVLNTTTMNLITIPGKRNAQNQYVLRWERANGDTVFEAVFYVRLGDYTNPATDGLLTSIVTNYSETFLQGNQYLPTYSDTGPWVLNLVVQPQ